MNKELFKYLAMGFATIYIFKLIKEQGATPKLINQAENMAGRMVSDLKISPQIKQQLINLSKTYARESAMRFSNIRDVTPLEEREKQ